MSEHEHPDHSGEHSVEFDRSRYPERVSCRAMPSLDGKIAEVVVADVWEDKDVIHGVPETALTRINMPQLGPSVPKEVERVVEQGHGLALVACRVEELEGEDPRDMESPIKIYVPTNLTDVELLVRRNRLARSVGRKRPE